MSAVETEPWHPHAKWSAESEVAGEAEWGGQGESSPAGPQSEAAYELESPFLSGVSFVPALPGEQASNENYGGDSQNLYSPFLGGMAAAGEVDHAGEFGQLLGQLEDEQFDEAVARLADEAAALHLASETSWSSPEVAPSLASSELETWVSPLAAESDRLLETMASGSRARTWKPSGNRSWSRSWSPCAQTRGSSRVPSSSSSAVCSTRRRAW